MTVVTVVFLVTKIKLSLPGESLEECGSWNDVVIAHGGSNSRGLYIFRTGVADALCSGQTHPARPVSPEDAACEGKH